jgi:hypothetical protein
MDVAHFTFLLFAVFSSVRVVSYLPQIWRVAQDTNGASAISYATWSLWTGANVATAFYAVVNLGDRWLATVSSVYAACCVCVIALTFAKRRNAGRSFVRLLVRAACALSHRRSDLAAQLQCAVAARASKMLGCGLKGDSSDLHLPRICQQLATCDVAFFILRLALAAGSSPRRHERTSEGADVVEHARFLHLDAAKPHQPSFLPVRCR